MGEFGPKGDQQRPADFRKTVEGLRSRISDPLVRSELLDMAEGGDGNGQGVREMYPGWKDEDFQALLTELGYPLKDVSKSDSAKRPSDFQEAADHLRSRISDPLVRSELLDMAEGGDPQGARQYYKGWKDDDFKALLAELGYPLRESNE